MTSLSEELTPDFIEMALDAVLTEAESLAAANADQVKAFAPAWDVVDLPDQSIRYMSDRELRQAIVTDVLSLLYWAQQNKPMTMTLEELHRHVPDPNLKQRIITQFHHPETQWHVAEDMSGILIVKEGALQRAQEFAGVFIDVKDFR